MDSGESFKMIFLIPVKKLILDKPIHIAVVLIPLYSPGGSTIFAAEVWDLWVLLVSLCLLRRAVYEVTERSNVII